MEKYNPELAFDQFTFEEKEFALNLPADGFTVTGAELSDKEKELILSRLNTRVTDLKNTA